MRLRSARLCSSSRNFAITKQPAKRTAKRKAASPPPRATSAPRRSACPIAFGLDIFGDRWTLLVIRDLIVQRKRRFREFLESEEGIATNVLAERLQRLEAAGIVTRSEDPSRGYTLTAKGKALLPVLLEIVRWSAAYDPETGAPPEFLQRLANDREALIAELLAGLE